MRKLALGLVLVAAAAMPASAQNWQTFTPSNSGTEFWNNRSVDNANDNVICNIGAVLTDAGLNSASCNNQTPSNLLPVNQFASGAGGGVFLNNHFVLGSGSYTIDLFGQIAGVVPTTWGIYTQQGGFQAYAGSIMHVDVAQNDFLYFWLDTFDPATSPNRFFSHGQVCDNPITTCSSIGSTQQHVLFSADNSLAGTMDGTYILDGVSVVTRPGVYYVGMEDNATRMSDWDYNDVVLRVSSVPEPSTYAMLAVGLVGMAGVARRRNRA